MSKSIANGKKLLAVFMSFVLAVSFMPACSQAPESSSSHSRTSSASATSVPEMTVGFADRGSIANGALRVTLSPESRMYANPVYSILSRQGDDGLPDTAISLSYIEDGNWDTLEFAYAPSGNQLLLDGRPFPFAQVDHSETTDTFVTLLMIDNRMRAFRFVRVKDGDGWRYEQVGIVEYNTELGISDKDVTPLKPGDTIRMNHETFAIGAGGPTITEALLPAGSYTCQLVATDIFGKDAASDTAVFEYDGATWRSATMK